MRVAFFSPMPPAKSGIADYSAALVEPLGRLVELEVFDSAPAAYDASRFDIALYQIGNNPYHEFVYQMALGHPGVIVLHEANLHYLLADLTIRRGDWDAYIREVEYNAGPEALAHARRVRALEVGPDYEGIPMTRRILESARGVIVHSSAVEEHVRNAGFRGPVARIPHGAWTPEADRWAYRERLGVVEATPLIGIFGFLKPYKRIPESLRAFRRLLRVEPRARMILAGEPHPDFPVESVIRTLGLEGRVRVLGFVDIADFTGYMAACDILLNLRHPTVGESSGSLLRAFGLGKPVLVSDVGAFRDLPDDTCFKVRVGPAEEDEIFEYLNQLVSRPELARALGARARAWVERECTWDRAAERYACFLEAVAQNRAEALADGSGSRIRADTPAMPDSRAAVRSQPGVAPDSLILEWSQPEPLFREYVDTHLTRLTKTLEITPPGGPEDRILEMGAYLQITPSLRSRLGYGEVRGCYYGKLGEVEHRSVVSAEGERFECDLELFDAEKDAFPYPGAYFATVLCCELVEHLFEDPMHMMSRDQPHPAGGRPSGADHAQHRLPARDFGDSAGLPSRPVPAVHQALGRRARRPAAQPRVHPARNSPALRGRGLRGDVARDRAVPRSAAARTGLGEPPARSPRPRRGSFAETASMRSGERPGPSAAATPNGCTLEERMTPVRIRIENTSAEVWKAEDGYAASYQVFDPETETLVSEGPRTPLARDLAPGEAVEIDVQVEFPPEPGRYRAFVSGMREHAGWFYGSGAPFVTVDAEVAGGRAILIRSKVTTASQLRRQNLLRSVGRAFQYPLLSIWRNRSLIRSMVRRDILGRYRGSFGGAFWTFLNPLLLMATYFFVFGIVLRARFGNDPSKAGFVLYFLCGMLPWLAFSEAVGRAPFVILEHRNFVKKLVFPLETLPVNLVSGRPRNRSLRARNFRAVSVVRARGRAGDGVVAPRAGGAAATIHDGRGVDSCGARSLSPRPGPDQRLPADALVLPDADLLSGGSAAARLAMGVLEKPDVRAGPGLPQPVSRSPASGLWPTLEILDSLADSLLRRPRLVLQAPQEFCGRAVRG